MGMATHRDEKWHGADEVPECCGWYECRAVDDRWNGETRFRAFGCGEWWIPLGRGGGSDGWLSSTIGLYEWKEPAYDVMGPPPDIKKVANAEAK